MKFDQRKSSSEVEFDPRIKQALSSLHKQACQGFGPQGLNLWPGVERQIRTTESTRRDWREFWSRFFPKPVFISFAAACAVALFVWDMGAWSQRDYQLLSETQPVQTATLKHALRLSPAVRNAYLNRVVTAKASDSRHAMLQRVVYSRHFLDRNFVTGGLRSNGGELTFVSLR